MTNRLQAAGLKSKQPPSFSMASPPPTTSAASPAEMFHLLRDPSIRKVGWGTGSCFWQCRWLSIPLDYLVDNDRRKWGTIMDGLPVRNPDTLRDEDPARLAVVVYSQFFDEISIDLQALGVRHYVSSITLIAHHRALERLRRIERSAPPDNSRARRSKCAIVMQGPIYPDITALLLRTLRALNPADALILSTWDNTPAKHLEKVRKLVDHLVLTADPEVPGSCNRNRQMATTKRGLEVAERIQAREVMKVRTDAAPLVPEVFKACNFIRGLYPKSEVKRHGLRERLIVPETFTRKFLLYHPSDLVMQGTLEDMVKYWIHEPDPRSFTHESAKWKQKSVSQVAREMHSPEGYFAVSFAKKVGLSLRYSVADSWRFLRDYFAVQSNEWLGLFWSKYPILPPVHSPNPLQECMSHYTWQQLVSRSLRPETGDRIFAPDSVRWGQFFNPKYKPLRRIR